MEHNKTYFTLAFIVGIIMVIVLSNFLLKRFKQTVYRKFGYEIFNGEATTTYVATGIMLTVAFYMWDGNLSKAQHPNWIIGLTIVSVTVLLLLWAANVKSTNFAYGTLGTLIGFAWLSIALYLACQNVLAVIVPGILYAVVKSWWSQGQSPDSAEEVSSESETVEEMLKRRDEEQWEGDIHNPQSPTYEG